jgi:hypothetical protein
MTKLSTALIAAIISISVVVPLTASAQTTTTSNTSVFTILTQLVQLLEQELQQLLAAQGGPTIPTIPPNPTMPMSPSIPPAIASVSPISGPLGTTVTITGSGFETSANSDNDVMFDGNQPVAFVDGSQNNGTCITFTLPMDPNYCLTPTGHECPGPILAGTHSVTVETANGTSNALSFTVNLAAMPISGTAPLDVIFSYPSGTLDLGDGSVLPFVTNACNDTSCGQVTHTYTTAGVYVAKLSDSSANVFGTATITVASGIPNQPDANIDQGSALSGIATGVQAVDVQILLPGRGAVESITTVSNGKWSVDPSSLGVPSGTYHVIVWTADGNTFLTSGTLTFK